MSEIMDVRRKSFEAWAMQKGWRVTRRNDPASTDEYMAYETQQRWECWSAALGSVCVELSSQSLLMRSETVEAIERTGIKVKP